MSSLPTYTGATRPSSPSAGDAIYLSDVNRLAVYDGDISEWRTFNSDGLVYNAAAPNELHYANGIYDSSSASYYINTQPKAHYDASLINGYDTAGNPAHSGVVSSWGDRSGNSNNLSQSNATNQPLFDSSSSNLNSKPSVVFDGSNDFLNLTDSITLTADFSMLVALKNVDANKAVAFGHAVTYTNVPWHRHINGSDYVFAANSGAITDPSNASVIAMTRASNSVKLYQNGGTPALTTTSSGTGTITVFGDSSLQHHNGEIAEAILFDSMISLTDLNTIHSYFANKYGFTTSTIS